jgi:predicted MFS family arabinose efflux permease
VLVPGLVFVATVVALVSSLGAPLVPRIAEVRDVPVGDAQWSLTITLLVGAVATPLMGRLGDGPHRRAVILLGLCAVVAGCALAALPLGFGALLVGRAAQGLGLGLTPLAMATARDALAPERARSAVAALSVTTVAGVGLGYPVTGLIAEVGGLSAAFWFGAGVAVVALAVALLVVPSTADRTSRPVDLLGAALLGAGLAGLLLGLSEAETWGWTSARLVAVVAASSLLLVGFVLRQLRTTSPLVDLRLVRHPSVLTADVTALLAGVGNYLLISLVTRYVQTPEDAGYGFGATVVVAGLVLVPFSVGSVAASRLAPLLSRRASPEAVLPVGCLLFLAALATFAFARTQLWQVLVAMALAGLGVGCTFAALPGLVVRGVPASETGSAMSFNQVLRYVGFSTGSAASAAVLAAATPAGRVLPDGDGYTTAALIGCATWALTGVLSLLLPRLGRSSAAQRDAAVDPAEELRLAEESVADAVPFDERGDGRAPVPPR